MVVAAGVRVFLGWLRLTSHLIKVSSGEHVMLHLSWSVVVHAASVSLTEESLVVLVGSLVVAVAAAMHWAF